MNTQTHNTVLEYSKNYQAAREVSIQGLREEQHKMRPIRNPQWAWSGSGFPVLRFSLLLLRVRFYVSVCSYAICACLWKPEKGFRYS